MRARALVLPLLVVGAAAAGATSNTAPEWGRFGYDPGRRNSGPAATGITAANLSKLIRRQVVLDGTADSSPILADGLAIVTTSYGKAIAVDVRTDRIRWRYTPPGYSGWAGSDRITNSSPLVSDDRDFVYTASPDGRIHKLELHTGREVKSGHWPAVVTRNPEREKLGTAINALGRLLFVTTGGYIGDAPPYQGHVVAINGATGAIEHVWNALCSNRRTLLDPATCSESGAAIWARSGVVLDPANGNVLVATGDGRWDGKRYWGDSVLVLAPEADRLVASWTPASQAELDSGDVDLGSTAPAMLPGRLALQSGKDGIMRLLDLAKLGLGKQGGEIQTLPTPSGGGLFSAPAVFGNWVYVADFGATAAYRLEGRRLKLVWRRSFSGTSPVRAGGLLYVYDPGGALRVYEPTTGRVLATLAAGPGHCNSPIVAAGAERRGRLSAP